MASLWSWSIGVGVIVLPPRAESSASSYVPGITGGVSGDAAKNWTGGKRWTRWRSKSAELGPQMRVCVKTLLGARTLSWSSTLQRRANRRLSTLLPAPRQPQRRLNATRVNLQQTPQQPGSLCRREAPSGLADATAGEWMMTLFAD